MRASCRPRCGDPQVAEVGQLAVLDRSSVGQDREPLRDLVGRVASNNAAWQVVEMDGHVPAPSRLAGRVHQPLPRPRAVRPANATGSRGKCARRSPCTAPRSAASRSSCRAGRRGQTPCGARTASTPRAACWRRRGARQPDSRNEPAPPPACHPRRQCRPPGTHDPAAGRRQRDTAARAAARRSRSSRPAPRSCPGSPRPPA